jgi:hypothetical protein
MYYTYQIRSLSDADPIRCQTHQMPNPSDAEPTVSGTDLLETEPIRYQTYSIRCRTYQMKNLSYAESLRYQTN